MNLKKKKKVFENVCNLRLEVKSRALCPSCVIPTLNNSYNTILLKIKKKKKKTLPKTKGHHIRPHSLPFQVFEVADLPKSPGFLWVTDFVAAYDFVTANGANIRESLVPGYPTAQTQRCTTTGRQWQECTLKQQPIKTDEACWPKRQISGTFQIKLPMNFPEDNQRDG